MPFFSVLFVAILPALVLLFYIYKKDIYKPEPTNQMFKAFGYGCLSTFIAMIIELPIMIIVSLINIPVIQEILQAFCVAAIPEEAVKLWLLYVFFKRCHFYDEYVDGIVYAVCVGLGFATIENIEYLFTADDWMSVGILRALLSVPGHYAFAVIMGYYYSLYVFSGRRNLQYKYLILLAPVLAHGIFDALLMVSSISVGGSFLLMVAFFYFNYKLHKGCSFKIQELLRRDREVTYRTINPQ